MVVLLPSLDYRRTFRRGMRGTDVAALQLNLGELSVDGIFGRKTEGRVIALQRDFGFAGDEVDGIAGLLTQRALCLSLSSPAARARSLPVGMLASVMANESGFAVAATARHGDGGWDIGAYQRSSGDNPSPSQGFLRDAYSVPVQAGDTAGRLRTTHDGITSVVESRYLDELASGNRDRFRWQMAVLSHNWPDAAEDIPRYGVIYEQDLARDDREAQWIIDATGGRLRTPRQWVANYVTRATALVKW